MTAIGPESPPLRRVRAFGPTAIMTPANALTLVRIAATPAMLFYVAHRRLDAPTLAAWVALCFTDGVDGILARRYGSTRSGAFLDPLADKFLVLGAMVALAAKHVFAWPFVVVIAVREVGMSVYRSVAGTRGVSIPATKAAKWKTFVQQISVGFAITPWLGRNALWIGQGLLVVATALTVWTGLGYLQAARRAPPARVYPRAVGRGGFGARRSSPNFLIRRIFRPRAVSPVPLEAALFRAF